MHKTRLRRLHRGSAKLVAMATLHLSVAFLPHYARLPLSFPSPRHRHSHGLSPPISCSFEPIDLDLSSLRDIPTVDINANRRANYQARRRLIQNRGVPNIHPEVNGQATKLEKLWKDWKKVQRESARLLEYLNFQEDPEDTLIIEDDGLFIERKYKEVKTTPVIITRRGEIL